MVVCKECNTEYVKMSNRQKYCSKRCTSSVFRKKRLQFIQKHKMDKGCALCGYKLHPVALHLDHIDPYTKAFNISKDLYIKSWSEILTEISKCRVLCANCHATETDRQGHSKVRREIT